LPRHYRIGFAAIAVAASLSAIAAAVALYQYHPLSVFLLVLPAVVGAYAVVLVLRRHHRPAPEPDSHPAAPAEGAGPEEVAALERQLVHRATHDALTGLANRAYLTDHLSRKIDEGTAANLALLLIDVAQHQVIDAGASEATVEEVLDQLTIIASQRLVGALRDGDLAARVGEHELAVAARVASDGGAEATRLGRRIVHALSRPASISGATIALDPTVAVIMGRLADDCSDMITAADLGLIAAKASARGRVELITR
jgi:diguanylate cyclase (GGDEF)-like protein